MDTSSAGTLNSPSLYSEGSKTSSSKSGETANKDRDPTKDNTTSPIDLECHIQAERITKILNDTIYKMKMAIVLPCLVQEYLTLSSTLSEDDFVDLLYIFEQYENPLFSVSVLNMSALDDLRAGDLSLNNRLNPELVHVLAILNDYPSLTATVDKLIEDLIVVTTGTTRSSDDEVIAKFKGSLNCLAQFEKFRDLMVIQMNRTAAEELAEKISTRRLTNSNEKLIGQIKEIKNDLKTESEQFEENMKLKSGIIAKQEQELSFLNHDASIRLKKKILDSERQMVLASRAHSVKKEMLQEEETETRDAYEILLRAHLIDEKNMRTRRFKVETQLLSWIQKYDLEMSDKQIELDEFTEKYEDELAQCEQLEAKLAEQDKDYIPLMAEREEEYHQEMTEKMNKFLVEHAARVIQSAWREVLANRAEKKKLKKQLKKIQAMAAASAPKGSAKK